MSIDLLTKGFPGRVTRCTNLHLKLIHRHIEETIVVLKYGPGTQKRCKQCDMFIPRGEMAAGHLGTKRCKRGADKKRHRLSATAAKIVVETELWAGAQAS